MKMVFRNSLILSLMVLVSYRAGAQQKWSLSRCVNHALAHNIDLTIQKNALAEQVIDLQQSKANRLPNFNLGSNVNFNFGRTIDGNTNAITYDKTMSNSYWLTSSISLFRGFVKSNTVHFNRYLLLANLEETERIENRLIFDIIASYYISAYSIELEKAAAKQVRLSELQYNRMLKLVAIGKESPVSAQDMKSQWVADQLKWQKAKNEKRQQLLKLKQLMRLDAQREFALDTTNLAQIRVEKRTIIDTVLDDVYRKMPEIKRQNYLLKACEKSLAMAKGKRYPELNMSMGMSSYFFDGNGLSYLNQIENNQSQFVNFTVLIPIFNGARVKSDINRKKLDLETQKLNLEKQKEQILSQVQIAYDNLQAAESEYKASVELLRFSRLSFESVAKKMEEGRASTTDFELAKQRLFSAEAAKSKAKLSFLMYYQILVFYETGDWEHLNKM